MKKAILILIVFGSAFVAAWFLLKQQKPAVVPVVPVETDEETEVYRLAPEGDAVYEGSKISSVPTSTTSTPTTTTSTVISASGRRTSFSYWDKNPETPFK